MCDLTYAAENKNLRPVVESSKFSKISNYFLNELNSPFFSEIKYKGYFKNETAYRLDEPRSFTKMRNLIYLDMDIPYGSQVKFNIAGWIYDDLVYYLYEYDTISGRSVRNDGESLVFLENLREEKDFSKVGLREFYIDVYFENFDIRLGKQYAIWGVLEGNRVTDEINPMDFKELILSDLLDFRIPLWMLKVNYYLKDTDFEFLWIPDIKFHKPSPQGSEWELLQEVPNTVYPKTFSIRNSELGFKVSKEILGAEISLSYFYTWDDFPVIFRRLRMAPNGDIIGVPEFKPTYMRMNMYGSTFVKAIGNFILKGELMWGTGKYFGIKLVDKDGDSYLDHNGAIQSNHLRWGLGLDFNYLGIEISPAFVQWIIQDFNESMIVDRYSSSLSVMLRKELDNFLFQLIAIDPISLKELLLRPKLTYNLTEKFHLSGGMDLFYGEKSVYGVIAEFGRVNRLRRVQSRFQFFGNFWGNDRVYVELKLNF